MSDFLLISTASSVFSSIIGSSFSTSLTLECPASDEIFGLAPVSLEGRDVAPIVAVTDVIEAADVACVEVSVDEMVGKQSLVTGRSASAVGGEVTEVELELLVVEVEDVVALDSDTVVATLFIAFALATTALYCCISITAASRRT